MLSNNMQEMLNKQINEELFSSYIYLSMSAYCSSLSLNGFAHWFAKQSAEETNHGMKIYKYLIEQNCLVKLRGIKEPPIEFSSLEDVLEQTLKHEEFITSCIHKLAGAALEERDFATYNMLQWFIEEQIEEESQAREILDKVKMVKNSGPGILSLDKEFSKRD